jgi:hypothetical protein
VRNAIIAAIILTLIGAAIMVYAILFLGSDNPDSQLPASEANEITLQQVQVRNTAEKCWVAYGGRVFDMTRLLIAKPEQTSTWSSVCGSSIDTLPAGVKVSSITLYQIGVLAP